MPKYEEAFLLALAESIRKHQRESGKTDRAAVIAQMRKEYADLPLSPGALAGIYRDYAGGGVKEFLEKFRKEEASEGQIIAQAILDWEPDRAAFASVYALAAKRLNEAFGTRRRADDVEAMIHKAGGLFELLCDCGIPELKARQAAKKPLMRQHT